MQVEYADISLLGHREDNQDRATVVNGKGAVLLAVFDGMGGHSDGALAAETAQKVVVDAFNHADKPLFDPLGFLHLALGKAHATVIGLGNSLAMEQRPRATCALCVVQRGEAWWAHVGDSRVYLLRNGQVVTRTRDHSHVEQLLREGSIREDEVQHHPMRNYVECCLGGEAMLPEMSLSRRCALEPGDILLVCSDGLWANLKDADIAGFANGGEEPFGAALKRLARRGVGASAPHSDNTTVASLRWLG